MTARGTFTLRPASTERGGAVAQSPHGRPTVSVVVPTYNYARYLPDAVGSVLSQKHVEVEVIVVDDHSTDDSLAVARRLAAGDDRVRVIARPANAGPVATFNAGLAEAHGEFLVRLDADDALTPGSLARAVALLQRHPEVGLVYGHPVHFEGDLPTTARERVTEWVIWKGADWLESRCRLGTNCITSPEVVMRSSVVAEVGGQRDLAHTHDMEMWFRIARASDVAWVAGVDQAWHREHAASLSAREVGVMTEFSERAAAFETLLTDGVGDPEEAARLLGLAHRALANEALVRTTQAYSAGRGDTEETAAYLAFARTMTDDLAALPRGRAAERAIRLGRSRARFSPSLFAAAVSHRIELVTGRARWRARGI